MFRKLTLDLIAIVAGFAVLAVGASAATMLDPLRPPEYSAGKAAGAKKKTVTKWYVNEILISGERRVAIVNDVTVAKGEKVNGARVMDITPAHVVLKYKDKLIYAQLSMIDVKKESINRVNQ